MNSKAHKGAPGKSPGVGGPVSPSPSRTAAPDEADATHWTFLSNHTHVLVCLAANPDQVLRDVAAQVGITERAVQRIVGELEAGGVLRRERDGRRNRYHLELGVPLRHPLEQHCRIGDVLDLVLRAKR